jgi:hypothetical protein
MMLHSISLLGDIAGVRVRRLGLEVGVRFRVGV